MEEKFHCPRIPKNDSFLIGQNTGTWIKDLKNIRRCSDCGSIHPMDLIDLMKLHMLTGSGLKMELTDKCYKYYVNDISKFYTQHLELLNEEDLNTFDLFSKKYSKFLKLGKDLKAIRDEEYDSYLKLSHKNKLEWLKTILQEPNFNSLGKRGLLTHLDGSIAVAVMTVGNLHMVSIYPDERRVKYGDVNFFPVSREELDNTITELYTKKELKEADMAQDKKLTFGQEVVGLNFNPSGEDKVAKAKQLFADILDLICPRGERDIDDPEGYSGMKYPFRKLAFDAIVMAQMAVVKYIIWKK